MTEQNQTNNREDPSKLVVKLGLAAVAFMGALAAYTFYLDEKESTPRLDIYENGKVVRTIYDQKEIAKYESEHGYVRPTTQATTQNK